MQCSFSLFIDKVHAKFIQLAQFYCSYLYCLFAGIIWLIFDLCDMYFFIITIPMKTFFHVPNIFFSFNMQYAHRLYTFLQDLAHFLQRHTH